MREFIFIFFLKEDVFIDPKINNVVYIYTYMGWWMEVHLCYSEDAECLYMDLFL